MAHTIGFVAYIVSILIALLAGLGAGFFLQIYNNLSTKKGLVKLLCGELQANHKMLETLTREGLPPRVEISDDVYRGLLSSGNMRYLAPHQKSLHALYASMRRNDHGVMEEISRQIEVLRASM